MKTTLSLLKYASYAAIVGILIFAWRKDLDNRDLLQANAKLRTTQSEFLASVNRPILIRGFAVPFASTLTSVEEHKEAGDRSRRLVLIYSGGCHYCDLQLPEWEKLLSNPKLKDVEVWLVALREDRVKSERLRRILIDQHLDYRIYSSRDPLAFTVATGVEHVPMTVMTRSRDGVDYVEFVASGFSGGSELELLGQNTNIAAANLGAHVRMTSLREGIRKSSQKNDSSVLNLSVSN